MKARRFFSSARLRSFLPTLSASDAARIAGQLLAAAALLVGFASWARGSLSPLPDGHFSAVGAIGLFAQNMLRWGSLFPVMPTDHAPTSASFYMHHPPGMFWTAAVLGKALGFSTWVLRFPALVYVTGTAFFLYRFGRELWGPIEGGLAALAFVALPITVGYANFSDLEQPVMFGCMLSTWAFLRFMRTGRGAYAAASVLGFLFAINHDWWGYLWGGFLLIGLFVAAYVLPEATLRGVSSRAIGRYWALMWGAAVLSLGVELYLLRDSGRMNDLVSTYFQRSAGSEAPLKAVLAARRYRIELMFGWLAIFLGKLALPVMLARAVAKRSGYELLPFPLLLAAIIQYVTFKQGADVHIFWPHPFALYFGFAAGALAATVREGVGWIARRLGPQPAARAARYAPWAALALVGIPVIFVLRDGLSIGRLAQETGGRFVEAQLDSHLDLADALAWFVPRTPPTAPIAFHTSVLATYGMHWQVRPHPLLASQPLDLRPPTLARVHVLDTRLMSLVEMRLCAGRFHVHIVGPYWLIDRQEPQAPLDGYRFEETRRRWPASWLFNDTEPARAIRADPWVTWEWRTTLGQAATEPAGEPVTPNQIRIAHNAALARGDAPRAAALRARLMARLNLPVRAAYSNKTELIGAIRTDDPKRVITLFFVAGTFKADALFSVHAKVISPPRLSTLPMDPADLEIATPPLPQTSLWKPGHIYTVEVVWRKRPGLERLTGSWASEAHRIDGRDPLEIAKR
jgi:hypothetical protein